MTGAWATLIVVASAFTVAVALYVYRALIRSQTVTNSTFSGNSAAYVGGGIYGTANLKGAILANNTISDGFLENCFATITDVGYNISDDNSCGFTASSSRNKTDPELDPAGMSAHGGPTETIALQSSSPAVDAIALEDLHRSSPVAEADYYRPAGRPPARCRRSLL